MRREKSGERKERERERERREEKTGEVGEKYDNSSEIYHSSVPCTGGVAVAELFSLGNHYRRSTNAPSSMLPARQCRGLNADYPLTSTFTCDRRGTTCHGQSREKDVTGNNRALASVIGAYHHCTTFGPELMHYGCTTTTTTRARTLLALLRRRWCAHGLRHEREKQRKIERERRGREREREPQHTP